MADIRIQMQCEGCGTTVTYSASEVGTVQECPNCKGWLDVPEISPVPTVFEQQTEEYDRQMHETARQQQIVAVQLEYAQRQIEKRDQLDVAEEAILTRAALLLDRWEILVGQMEQMLQRMDLRRGDG